MKWLPPETAPKDGSTIIGYSIAGDTVGPMSWWDKDGGTRDRIPGIKAGWHYDGQSQVSVQPLRYPNHDGPLELDAWMPMPDAPELETRVIFSS